VAVAVLYLSLIHAHVPTHSLALVLSHVHAHSLALAHKRNVFTTA